MAVSSHLRSLQALEAALRAGSLRAAADELAVTPAAVGQRIKALEDFLGVDLLQRGRSGLAPTAALAPAVEHLRSAFRELAFASDALDLERRHEIRVAAVSDFAELWLDGRLRGYRAAHPGAAVRVNGEGATGRPAAADCTIDFGPAPDDDTVADALFPDFVLPISSPENTIRIGAEHGRAELEGFPLLHLDFYKDDPAVPGWTEWVRAQGLARSAPNRGIRFQRITPVLEAVCADAGLALCGLALVTDRLADGRLSLPFPMESGTWTRHVFRARYRRDALARPQVRRFRAWLAEEARVARDHLEATVNGGRIPVSAVRPSAR